MISTLDSHGPAPKRRGFALVMVIWGVAIIALLVVSYQSTARLRLQTAFNIAGATRAELVADAAANEAILSILSERAAGGERPVYGGAPVYCAIDGAAVAIAVEDEGGKVDLNAASPNLLQALLQGFAVQPRDAEQIAKSIVAFRTPIDPRTASAIEPGGAGDKPFGLKRAPYQTVLELDQTPGISPEFFRLLLPFVTVHSRAPGVDPRVAPPALFAALTGASPEEVIGYVATPFPNNLDRRRANGPFFAQLGEGGALLAHAEALLPTGQASVREVVVDLRGGAGGAYAIRELRRGQTRFLSRLRALGGSGQGADLPACG
jgi:general secretion pathway protein K